MHVIEQTEGKAKVDVAAKVNVSDWQRRQSMADVISSASDLTNDSHGSSCNDDGPPAVDANAEGYNHTDNRRGKGPVRKW